jgi:hypothetical protein
MMAIAKPPVRNGVAALQQKVCFCIGTAHLYLRQSRRVLLALRTGAGTFYKHSILEPGGPQCANACGFFNGRLLRKNGGPLIPIGRVSFGVWTR